MLFPEDEAPLLKKWIMQRLADTSDADGDVLADYVLALLRHDADIETVRQLCLSEIPDFLKEDSAVFVQDVFHAIQFKSYLPGAPPPPRQATSVAPPSGPAAAAYGNLGVSGQLGPLNGARKRSYNDRGDSDSQDRGFQGGERVYKQMRRGGPGFGRGVHDGGYNPRGGYGGNRAPALNPSAQSPFPNMPPMPTPPPGMPAFDPNNPMAAILAMQAMGFPLPGMPQPPEVGGTGQGPRGPPGPPNTRRRGRCRDYDEKGFCARGSDCRFEHNEQAAWAPPDRSRDEYDPNASQLIPPLPNVQSRGGGRGGRGQGAGGRGDFNNRRGGRSEFSSDRPNQDPNNTTIVVENIPEEKFTEEEVKGFFNEFGTIVEVSMRPYKRLAIVKFTDWDAANAAYKSPKVIFDNRFVKVYWFANQDSLPQPKSNGAGFPNTHASRPAEQPIDMEEFTRKQEELQKAHEEKMRKKQEVEVARQELEKRQQVQAEERRKLLEKIAAKTGGKASPPSDAAKQEESTTGEAQTPSTTDVLKAQLAALEAEAQSLGIDTTALPDQALGAGGRGGNRGRGGYRGRGSAPRGYRGGYRGRGGASFGAGPAAGSVMRLDNRPKTISLTGVDFTHSEKDEALRQYLLGVGDYTSLNTTPALTAITFKERYIAENFMYKTPGCEIPGAGRVEMAWVKNAPAPAASSSTAADQSTSSSAKAITDVEKNGDGDVNMGDDGGGSDAAMGNERAGEAFGESRREQNLDYDVAEDEWM